MRRAPSLGSPRVGFVERTSWTAGAERVLGLAAARGTSRAGLAGLCRPSSFRSMDGLGSQDLDASEGSWLHCPAAHRTRRRLYSYIQQLGLVARTARRPGGNLQRPFHRHLRARYLTYELGTRHSRGHPQTGRVGCTCTIHGRYTYMYLVWIGLNVPHPHTYVPCAPPACLRYLDTYLQYLPTCRASPPARERAPQSIHPIGASATHQQRLVRPGTTSLALLLLLYVLASRHLSPIRARSILPGHTCCHPTSP